MLGFGIALTAVGSALALFMIIGSYAYDKQDQRTWFPRILRRIGSGLLVSEILFWALRAGRHLTIGQFGSILVIVGGVGFVSRLVPIIRTNLQDVKPKHRAFGRMPEEESVR